MANADTDPSGDIAFARKKPEDSIPVVEIRGEGKPMTPAQIRSLEEISNGGPLDIKVIFGIRICQHSVFRLRKPGSPLNAHMPLNVLTLLHSITKVFWRTAKNLIKPMDEDRSQFNWALGW